MEGVGNQLYTEMSPSVLRKSVQPGMDLADFMVPAIPLGGGLAIDQPQFFDGQATQGSGSKVIIRMPVLEGEVLGISEVNMAMGSINTTAGVRFFARAGMVARGAGPAGFTWLAQHGYVVNDNEGGSPGYNQVLSRKLGKFVVQGPADYIIHIVVLTVGATITVLAAVSGARWPRGTWPMRLL